MSDKLESSNYNDNNTNTLHNDRVISTIENIDADADAQLSKYLGERIGMIDPELQGKITKACNTTINALNENTNKDTNKNKIAELNKVLALFKNNNNIHNAPEDTTLSGKTLTVGNSFSLTINTDPAKQELANSIADGNYIEYKNQKINGAEYTIVIKNESGKINTYFNKTKDTVQGGGEVDNAQKEVVDTKKKEEEVPAVTTPKIENIQVPSGLTLSNIKQKKDKISKSPNSFHYESPFFKNERYIEYTFGDNKVLLVNSQDNVRGTITKKDSNGKRYPILNIQKITSEQELKRTYKNEMAHIQIKEKYPKLTVGKQEVLAEKSLMKDDNEGIREGLTRALEQTGDTTANGYADLNSFYKNVFKKTFPKKSFYKKTIKDLTDTELTSFGTKYIEMADANITTLSTANIGSNQVDDSNASQKREKSKKTETEKETTTLVENALEDVEDGESLKKTLTHILKTHQEYIIDKEIILLEKQTLENGELVGPISTEDLENDGKTLKPGVDEIYNEKFNKGELPGFSISTLLSGITKIGYDKRQKQGLFHFLNPNIGTLSDTEQLQYIKNISKGNGIIEDSPEEKILGKLETKNKVNMLNEFRKSKKKNKEKTTGGSQGKLMNQFTNLIKAENNIVTITGGIIDESAFTSTDADIIQIQKGTGNIEYISSEDYTKRKDEYINTADTEVSDKGLKIDHLDLFFEKNNIDEALVREKRGSLSVDNNKILLGTGKDQATVTLDDTGLISTITGNLGDESYTVKYPKLQDNISPAAKTEYNTQLLVNTKDLQDKFYTLDKKQSKFFTRSSKKTLLLAQNGFLVKNASALITGERKENNTFPMKDPNLEKEFSTGMDIRNITVEKKQVSSVNNSKNNNITNALQKNNSN